METTGYIRVVRPQGDISSSLKTKSKKKNKKKKQNTSAAASVTGNDSQVNIGTCCRCSKEGNLKEIEIQKTVKAFGFSEDEVKAATQRLQDSDTALSYESLIDTVYQVLREHIEGDVDQTQSRSDSSPTTTNQQSHEEHAQFSTHHRETREAPGTRALELQQAIESLQSTCKLCHSCPASVLMLPCGHLASCDSCLMDVRRCPVSSCNKIVRATKRIYFS